MQRVRLKTFVLAMTTMTALSTGTVQAAWTEDATACQNFAESPSVDGLAACGRAIESGELREHHVAYMFTYRGMGNLKDGRFKAAADDFQQSIDILPRQNTAAYMGRGDALMKLEDFDRAIISYNEAALESPTDPQAFYKLGQAYDAIKKPTSAARYYKEAVRLDNDNLMANVMLGRAKGRTGNYVEALRHYARASEIDTDLAGAYSAQGWAFSQLGMIDEAIMAMKKAQSIDPNEPIARRLLPDLVDRQASTEQQQDTLVKAHPQHLVIREVQHALQALNYPIDAITGVNNPATQAAIRDYQSRVGLTVTGTVDTILRDRIVADAASRDIEIRKAEQQTVRKLAKKDQEERERELERQRQIAEEEAERERLAKHDELKRQEEEKAARLRAEALANDRTSPEIVVEREFVTFAATAIVTGVVSDNLSAVSVQIDEQLVEVAEDGSFSADVALRINQRKSAIVMATDESGNQSDVEIFLERKPPQAAAIEVEPLRPESIRTPIRDNAVAIVVGIERYNQIPEALYADRDAQYFYDYAINAFGVPPENVIYIDQDSANRGNILTTLFTQLAPRVTAGETEIYAYFAGHGLANNDKRYLLPNDALPMMEMLDQLAISRETLIETMSNMNPKGITLFLDTCYTGDTRTDGGTLCEGCRGMKVVPRETLPPKVTIISAAGSDQVSSALDEARHGLFSYWTMKGLEGSADLDGDGDIEAGELHEYARTNVSRHATRLGRQQTPTLEGDPARVLVEFPRS